MRVERNSQTLQYQPPSRYALAWILVRILMRRNPQHASNSTPRSVDFSGAQLTVTSAAILSDVFTIEWGLRKLVFRECNLDDQVRFRYFFQFNFLIVVLQMLKSMLHALLIPGSLTFLSVASNRRLKAPAYRVIGAYVSKVSLQIQSLRLWS